MGFALIWGMEQVCAQTKKSGVLRTHYWLCVLVAHYYYYYYQYLLRRTS